MDGHQQLMRLPLELIFHVMTSLLPSNPHALIPVTHDATQLLVSFCLVSRATHEFAVRKLRQHCLYLDCDIRLGRFLLCLEASRAPGARLLRLPTVFRDIASLYLSPFENNLDNLPTAQWTRELCYYVCGTLRRLVVDLPFDSLPPWEDHLNVGPVLQEGLAQLTRLEEFVCTRDAARFDAGGDDDDSGELRPILLQWPNLRRLGLHRPRCAPRFWQCIADAPNLQQVVLARPMAITSAPNYLDFKALYSQRTARPIRVLLAETQRYLPPRTKVAALEAADTMRVTGYLIPRFEGHTSLGRLGSDWLMRTALGGELWGIEGLPLRGPPTLTDLVIAELE